jgi:hypothetical protein
MSDDDIRPLDPALQNIFMWEAVEGIEDFEPFFARLKELNTWWKSLPADVQTVMQELLVNDTLILLRDKVGVLCSDTFAYACADFEAAPLDQLSVIKHMDSTYGYAGLAAWVAHRRMKDEPDIRPIDCKCHGNNPEFMAKYDAAMRELNTHGLKDAPPEGPPA